MQSRRVTTVIHANQKEFFTDKLELVMEVGRAKTGSQEPMASLRWSDDSGYTWGNWLNISLGEIGKYQQKSYVVSVGAVKKPRI